MKKILLGLAVVSAALFAKAEYLFWQVGDTTTVGDQTYTFGDQYNAGVLYWTGSGTPYQKLEGINFAGTTTTDLASYGITESTGSFYIELGTYDNGNFTAIAHSEMITYAETANYRTSFQTAVSSMQAWSGGSFSPGAVPEPTSGLMVLIGTALLGVKRRRV